MNVTMVIIYTFLDNVSPGLAPGGHIFLGNPVLPERMYCPPLDQVSSL